MPKSYVKYTNVLHYGSMRQCYFSGTGTYMKSKSNGEKRKANTVKFKHPKGMTALGKEIGINHTIVRFLKGKRKSSL